MPMPPTPTPTLDLPALSRPASRENRSSPAGRNLTVGLGDAEMPTMTAAQRANARRVAEYAARRNGAKAALLQLWKETR